ncbi:hypothetical protein MN116_000179, partial [Schistosoma mekongi]
HKMRSLQIITVIITYNIVVRASKTMNKERKLNAKSAELLRIHNKYRQDLVDCKVEGQPPAKYMPPLKWNYNLAKQAQNLANKCILRHELATSSKFHWVGQNIAIHPSIQSGVDAWFNEHKMYNFYGGKCDECLHYTQMVWAKTTDIGCGVAKCPAYQGFAIVCNYGPGGNWNNEKPYEVKRRDECPDVRNSASRNAQSPPVKYNPESLRLHQNHQDLSTLPHNGQARSRIKHPAQSSKRPTECKCNSVQEIH